MEVKLNLESATFFEGSKISQFNRDIVSMSPQVSTVDKFIHSTEEAISEATVIIKNDPRLKKMAEIIDLTKIQFLTISSSDEIGEFGLFFDQLGGLVARVNQDTGEVSIPTVLRTDEIITTESKSDSDVRVNKYIDMLKQSSAPPIFVAGKTEAGGKFKVINGNARTHAAVRSKEEFMRAVVFLRTSDMKRLKIPSKSGRISDDNKVADIFCMALEQIKNQV